MSTPEAKHAAGVDVEKICEAACEDWIAAGTGNDPAPFFAKRFAQACAPLVAENERLLAAISQAGAEMVLGNDSRAMRILDAALTGIGKQYGR